MKRFWDMPCPALYYFKDKSELNIFLNKTQLHYEFECIENDDTFGISFKTKILDDSGEVEYDVDIEACNAGNCGYTLPIHDRNEYFETERQFASRRHAFGVVQTKPDDLILDERWSFPCRVFIWIETRCDRVGDMEIKLFHVVPEGSEYTIQKTQDVENTYSDLWVKNLEDAIKREKVIDELRRKR